MKQVFSKKWKSSKSPRKQRKYRLNAPLHIKKKFISANLSKSLRTKYNVRSFGLRKGDKVKITTGQYKGKEGVIESVDIKREKVTVSTAFEMRRDNSKRFYPIHPSNVQILDMNLEDKQRKASLARKKPSDKKEKQETQ